jgi:ABC-2 type transport system permease protein
MKALDIAWKDVKHAFRSAFSLVFMFGVPILITGLFVLMFGGVGGGEEGFELPQTKVQVVNLDPGTGDVNMGAVLVDMLTAEGLSDILAATVVDDPEAARGAVDAQEAGVAVIIPADLTAAVIDPAAEAETALEVYQDPTRSIGPGIVKMILKQFMDSFSGTRIVSNVVAAQLEAADLPVSTAQVQDAVNAYVVWAQQRGETGEATRFIAVESPSQVAEGEASSQLAAMLGIIQMGMMVFYAYFTATTSAQTILSEEEAGTLPRLFTTPTPVGTVLRGKFLANALTILVQVIVLVTFGTVAFGIDYGSLGGIALATVLTVASATTFGIFLMSFMESTRQTGLIYGGVVVVTGMLGIVDSFTGGGFTGRVIDVLPLVAPQGWVYKLWLAVMDRAVLSRGWLYAAGLIVWSAIFFIVGRARFRRRFA